MYFLTKEDPEYSIKGSRDPLGFQVIWQNAGRKLIPNLSTVSNNIVDFQILCLAHALKTELIISDKHFEKFFLAFEQMMAYVRFQSAPSFGFNGVDKVRKIMNGNLKEVSVSAASKYQLLSNQKSYGIWGKYNSPFSKIGITNKPQFSTIFNTKIKDNQSFYNQVKFIAKKTNEEVSKLALYKLEDWVTVIEKPNKEEIELFIELLLNDTCDNELLGLVDEDLIFERGNLFSFLEQSIAKSNNPKFKSILSYIINIEKTICPLNRIFRYLQTKSFWKKEDLQNDVWIKKWRNEIITDGFEEATKSLALLHLGDNYDLVVGLVKRNEFVCTNRNSAAWMQLTDKGIEVNHFDGGFINENYEPAIHNDFSYFLDSFFSLYKQLN